MALSLYTSNATRVLMKDDAPAPKAHAAVRSTM